MKYSILCSDLDGTLLATKNNVTDFAIAQISRIAPYTKVILVSARMPAAMTYIQKRLCIEEQPIICYNGALVLDGDQVLSSTEIAAPLLQEIYDMALALKVKLGLYQLNNWFVEEDTARVQKEIHHTQVTPVFQPTIETLAQWEYGQTGAHKLMLMGTKAGIDILYAQLTTRFASQLHIYRSNDTLIEVASKTISKLTAIQLLLNASESLEEVVAFGDNYNDLEMLQAVGCGVAVANARTEVKAIANYITLKNTEDGVAHFIKEHL